jgi:hypothetical protein
MGIPVKGSRAIEVDSIKFRYLVRKERLTLGVRVVTAQKVGPSGKPSGKILQVKLRTKLRVGMDEDEKPDDNVTMTPEEVRGVIQNALDRGWDPAHKSGVFTDVKFQTENWETPAS